MGFDKFSKMISSAIFEEETEEQTSSAPQEQAQPVVQTQGSVQAPQQPSSISTSVGDAFIDSNGNVQYTGKVREKFAELMLQSIDERNIPGPDYAELKSAFESEDLKANISDIEKRWKTAFSMMKMMDKKFTKQVVLSSIDTYASVVDEERGAALTQMQSKYNATVGKLEADVANTETLIKEDEGEIRKLQEQITKLQEKINKNQEFIASSRQKINDGKIESFVDKADLEATAQAIKNSLLSDKKKLDEILPND